MGVGIPDGQDVVVCKVPQNLRLPPRAERVHGRVQHLERDGVVLVVVEDLEDGTLAAASEGPQNFVPLSNQTSDLDHRANDTVLDMRALAIAVEMKQKDLRLRAVVVDDATGQPAIETSFERSGLGSDLAASLRDTAKAFGTKVKTLAPDVVVVRRADNSPRASRLDAPKIRLLMEGAVTAAACAECAKTFVVTGADLAGWTGLDKKVLDDRGKTLATGAGLAQRYTEAAATAIAALSHP